LAGFFICDAGWFAFLPFGGGGCSAGVADWCFWRLRWHPHFAFVLHASPLCGAAPTFLCRRKEK
jgi:hypothetical protein